MTPLEEQAIQAALDGLWEKAIALNSKILSIYKNNVDALTRKAYAHLQLGQYEKAGELYKEILQLDPSNPIAKKNLRKCTSYKTKRGNAHLSHHRLHPDLFVSDAEKTRIVQLINVAPAHIINSISIGEEVFPFCKGFDVHIRTDSHVYLGTLPDDVGRKLIRVIKKNESCKCFIKDIDRSAITIFIKWDESE